MLIVTEYFENDWLRFQELNECFCYGNRYLWMDRRNGKLINLAKMRCNFVLSYVLHMIETKCSSWSGVFYRFGGECLFVTIQKAVGIVGNILSPYVWRNVKSKIWLDPWTHLNWQKMSAYSAEMPVACSTVTRNVNSFPICKCSPDSSATSCSSDETLESPRPESASSCSISWLQNSR